MADIAMCQNKECPNANLCYRFTGPVSLLRQSYAEFEPDESGKCKDFIDNRSAQAQG